MKMKLFVLVAAFALIGGFAIAQDLTIDYVLQNGPGSYFTFSGPIRYMAADKDHIDVTTGASVQLSTEKFQPYRYDVKGKNAFPDTLRGLFLFAVAVPEQRTMDNLTIEKASNGVITIQYVHRGTAYKAVTDRYGRLSLPNGEFNKRAIGYISGHDPQVLHRDFSRDGSAARVDWNKVWNSGIAGGKTIGSKKTGDVVSDRAASDSMYYWDGTLQVSYDNNVLKVSGGLNAVKR